MANQESIIIVNGARRRTAAGDTVPLARLGSGTPDATTFLRGDASWAVPSSSLDIIGLTEGNPDLPDSVPIYSSGVGANRRITFSEIGFLTRFYSGGRLTTETGVAVSTSDRTAQGTLYYTPYLSSVIELFDGNRWASYTFTERSLALTLTSGKNYDVFLWDNGGTLTLYLSAAWTNDTTRADALGTQDGIYVDGADNTKRWLGTIRASGTNTTEDSAAKRFVWNLYNREKRHLRVIDATVSWTYTTASWRQANGASANKVEYVTGLNHLVNARVLAAASNSTGAPVALVNVGIDSTTSPAGSLSSPGVTPTGTDRDSIVADYVGYPGIGYHYLAWLEFAGAAGTTTWFGDNGSGNERHGIHAEILG